MEFYHSMFRDQHGRSSTNSNPKIGLYRLDSIDLGYHTLENNGCVVPSRRSHSTQNAFQAELCDLDDDLLLKIYRYLSTKDRCTLAQTCRRLWKVAWHPSLWKKVEVRHPQSATAALNALVRRGYNASLQKLFLEGINEIPGVFVTLSFSNLTSLALRHSRRATDENVTNILDSCVHLRELDLTGCTGITKACSRSASLQLDSLDLSDCQGLDDSGLKQSLSRMPFLSCLYLRRCLRITDTSLVDIASYCSNLRQLSVSDCVKVTDFGVRELAGRLGPSLRYFSVGKCDRVSDAGLLVVARHCYKLRYLNARSCEALSDSAMVVLAQGCPRLRALDLGKCDVGDATLKALSISCPNLKKLSLCGCERVTDAGLESLAYYVRGLCQLNIGDCPLVSWVGYRAVKRYCRRCVIEHTNPGFCS